MNREKRGSPIISLLALLKSFIIGCLIAEIFVLMKALINGFCGKIIQNYFFVIIEISYVLIIVDLLLKSSVQRKIMRILNSYRIDLLILSISGFFLILSFGGVGATPFHGWVVSLSWSQLLILTSLPILVYSSLTVRRIQAKLIKLNDLNSFFMSDMAGKNKSDDKFNFTEQAERFAERIFDGGSSESLVFGIDAPWGTGKTTFVNLCKEYWKAEHKNDIIIYSFEPLKYENKDDLLNKFIDGLIKEIKQEVFVPEIDWLVSKYYKLLRDSKTSFSLFGLNFGTPFITESLDEIFEKLETTLLHTRKKIVVIVDDLDRLDFSTMKEVLFVIKKAFTLPNISYVLCYDTDNIAALEQNNPDTEKIAEFLEKFINIKLGIYLDNELLLKYFTEYKDLSLGMNSLANPELVSKAVEGVKEIFGSREYHLYLPFIGDARKIKRLINTILLLEVEKTDFENCDFDKQDLIHLLLIYINYPHIFRKIYNTETHGKKGFFSVGTDISQRGQYINSSDYKDYLDKLSTNQRFILNKVFDSQKTKNPYYSACFNDAGLTGKGNLESYLYLITKMSRPIKTQQYKFYMNSKDQILSDRPIEEKVQEQEFSSEISHKHFWRALINSPAKEFTREKSKEIILYLLSHLPQYSILEVNDELVGLRKELPFYLIKLLDKVGWVDAAGSHFDNTDENVGKIANWIFGEDEYKGIGVLDALADEERGILGLYDLISFRLFCCTDRGGDIFNLSRALLKHGNPKASHTGPVNELVIKEMREMSQVVFSVFKAQFMDKRKNIFDEIDGVTIEGACGRFYNRIKDGNAINLDKGLLVMKSTMKTFIIFQLGNTIIDHGIGCGYYDANGSENNHEINRAINDYLFNICFNPQINEGNYKHFLDYLLINLSYSIRLEGIQYIPSINEFTKVLNKDSLTDYWQRHRDTIKASNFVKEDKSIVCAGYSVTYEYLDRIYPVLDKLCDNN